MILIFGDETTSTQLIAKDKQEKYEGCEKKMATWFSNVWCGDLHQDQT